MRRLAKSRDFVIQGSPDVIARRSAKRSRLSVRRLMLGSPSHADTTKSTRSHALSVAPPPADVLLSTPRPRSTRRTLLRPRNPTRQHRASRSSPEASAPTPNAPESPAHWSHAGHGRCACACAARPGALSRLSRARHPPSRRCGVGIWREAALRRHTRRPRRDLRRRAAISAPKPRSACDLIQEVGAARLLGCDHTHASSSSPPPRRTPASRSWA